jgi:hypothetical protein
MPTQISTYMNNAQATRTAKRRLVAPNVHVISWNKPAGDPPWIRYTIPNIQTLEAKRVTIGYQLLDDGLGFSEGTTGMGYLIRARQDINDELRMTNPTTEVSFPPEVVLLGDQVTGGATKRAGTIDIFQCGPRDALGVEPWTVNVEESSVRTDPYHRAIIPIYSALDIEFEPMELSSSGSASDLQFNVIITIQF